MKTIKKAVALFLVLAMAAVMGTSAFAAAAYSITVTNTNADISISGKTYSAYKLFDVTYDLKADGTAGDAYSYTVAAAFADFAYTVGEGSEAVTYQGDADTAGTKSLVTYLGTLTSDSDALNAFAAAALAYAADNSVTASGSAAAVGESALIELSEPGYYLVAGAADAEGREVTAACSLTTTNPRAVISPKADAPKLDKVIVGADSAAAPETDGSGTALDVGGTVTFSLRSFVPDMTGYTAYTYIVHDTLSDGLTAVDGDDEDSAIDVAVTIDGVPYAGFTVEQEGQSFTVTFNDFISQKENAGKEVVLTYAAVLNSGALATDRETNTACLEYSNNPYDEESTVKTPDSVVYVYDFDLILDKCVKDANATKLAGARFVLCKTESGVNSYYKADAATGAVTWVPVTAAAGQSEAEAVAAAAAAGTITEVTTNDQGWASFAGLDAGSYKLLETAAPDGYNRLTGPVDVTITAAYNADGTLLSSSATVGENNGQYTQTAKIENSTGTILPETGGMGTTAFYIVGGLLMTGAAVLLITRKKMSAGKD